MELNHDFKIGDEVYHVSNHRLVMAIEDIDHDRIECSYYNEKPTSIESQKSNYNSLSKVTKGPSMRVESIIV